MPKWVVNLGVPTSGHQRRDSYRGLVCVDVAISGQYRIDLIFTYYDHDNGHCNDLDMYVFQEIGGEVVNSARADDSQGKPEWMVFSSMPAGRYWVAVQAWDTPTATVPYTLALREQPVPVYKSAGGEESLRCTASSGK